MANLSRTVGIIFHAKDDASAVTSRIAGDLKTILSVSASERPFRC